MIEPRILDIRNIKDLRPYVLDANGRLKVMPASFYENTTMPERAALGNRIAAYVLPTEELIEYLRGVIAGRTAIEIGAGNGVVSDALGIVGTDNKMQQWPEIRAAYASLNSPVIEYGPNVVQIAARDAVRQYRPQVVIACWVTHRWQDVRPHAGGNMYGVDEEAIIRRCDEYVLVGNTHVHQHKSIWKLPHEIITPPWLYSRAHNMSKEFIAIWRKNK